MGIDRETFKYIASEWKVDNSPEMDDLYLIGEPYIDEDGHWTQEAETETHVYTLIATDSGDIHLRYSGAK